MWPIALADWSRSVAIDAVIWLVPVAIIVALGLMVWRSTHRLYPEQNIAVVNELVFPSEPPPSQTLTSDTVVNSFSIPELGGQVYAMPGMQTRLHLVANAPGRFDGRNTQYSRSGFADQHFEAIATSEQDCDAWLAKVRQSPNNLDSVAYRALAARGIARATTHYLAVEPGLFDAIVAKYAPEAARYGSCSI